MKVSGSHRHRLLRSGLLCLIWCLALFPAGGRAADPLTADDLVYVTENFPPHNYLENSRLVGASVDILEQIWKKLGSARTRDHVQIMPWARAMKLLEVSPNMVLFAMGYSEERAEKFHWVGPYFTHELSLIVKKDDPVPIHNLDDAREFTIGVVRLDIGHQFLVENFFDPAGLDLCDDIDQLHRKFTHGRFRVICYVSHVFLNYAQSARNYEKILTVSEMTSGFGFSRRIPPALVEKFQIALDELRADGSVDSILKQYRMK